MRPFFCSSFSNIYIRDIGVIFSLYGFVSEWSGACVFFCSIIPFPLSFCAIALFILIRPSPAWEILPFRWYLTAIPLSYFLSCISFPLHARLYTTSDGACFPWIRIRLLFHRSDLIPLMFFAFLITAPCLVPCALWGETLDGLMVFTFHGLVSGV